MLGEGSKYISDCLKNNYIGIGFLKDYDLSSIPYDDEHEWRQKLIAKFLEVNSDKSAVTARNSIGFLWTICYGLKRGDVVLASNGEGGYCVAEILGDYYYAPNHALPHRREVKWLNVVIPRSAMSQKLKNSTGSIGTCCNVTKYADELQHLIATTETSSSAAATTATAAMEQEKPAKPSRQEPYRERSLHRLLANYLLEHNIQSKTIFHESSNRADQAQKWVHPDMVGVEYNEFQEAATRSLLKAAETKEYIALYSYELKRVISSDHQLKEYYFQALSNSSWANYGYLVAFEISEDVMEEMARLNRAFGIGVIKLSPYSDDTKELFPAKRNELDYYTIDKLCRINPDFKNFITKVTKVINAPTEVLDDVKGGLRKFCDKGFSSQDEILAYCSESHIPC